MHPQRSSLTAVFRAQGTTAEAAAELWQVAGREAGPIADDLANLRGHLVPARFLWLLAILGLLMAMGVVTPMFFLSASDDASQPLYLVGGFVPLPFVPLVILAYELRQLRRADRPSWRHVLERLDEAQP